MIQTRTTINSHFLSKILSAARRLLHTERKINVDGININIVEAGAGNETVLLMPGAVGSAWTDFKPQIEQLPKLLPNHKIVAWDPPGYGKSIPPQRKWSVDFFHDDANSAMKLMKALDRQKFKILGWSDGGITALIMAGTYTENVEKLVIWGTGAYLIPEEKKVLKGIRDVQKWSPRMREPMEQIYGVERFAEIWGEWVDTMVEICKKRGGDLCRKEVENISAPVFILHGKKDPMIAEEHVPYLRERLENCSYSEFPEGKHNIHLRYAAEFNEMVASFLLNKETSNNE